MVEKKDVCIDKMDNGVAIIHESLRIGSMIFLTYAYASTDNRINKYKTIIQRLHFSHAVYKNIEA